MNYPAASYGVSSSVLARHSVLDTPAPDSDPGSAGMTNSRQAYTDFGKGRHPAGLNFGDCFAYALAKVTGEPLLFKGEDFNKTDITSAL